MFSAPQLLSYPVKPLLPHPAHDGLAVRSKGSVDAARRQVKLIRNGPDAQRLVPQVFQDVVLHQLAARETVRIGDPAGKAAQAGELCAQDDGPISREYAVHTDEQGFDNQVIIAYWDDAEAYGRWFGKHRDALIGVGLEPAGHGRWIEAFSPEARGFETLYSSNTFPEGAARVATGGYSGEIQEHGYWGSMRDRLPVAQTEALQPAGHPYAAGNSGIVRVEPHHNLAVIRSGQDWSLCEDAERASYCGDVEPQLSAGMDFLTRDGASIGCYANRYMTSSDGAGTVLEQSFGLSFWHSLEDMERWAESHPTHVAIFMAAMKFLQANAGARLRLSHEVAVVSHGTSSTTSTTIATPQTGMLGARPLGGGVSG
jgi:aldoxime dehydratase